ncbi:MAG: ubiquitin-binding protein [Candidatus Pelagibacter sp.]|nr:ubiquitin-binding protein [Candidatus Pelagibacter sp.]OUW23688.1 MAG: ubiquitin-binding protein [Rickettsiales bacterium TMED174]|tara:strand:+ start:370 stop:555 length:186 start_codon:yes stop_codon:yes gene_type:complete
MKDLITAIGLLFFIEGLLVAMFPSRIKNMLLIINKIPETKLRKSGLLFLGIGFFIVWYIKN